MPHQLRAAPLAGVAAMILIAWSASAPVAADVNVSIDADVSAATLISPYVYGINHFGDDVVSQLGNNAGLARIGGNRWTAYNWETNASNAGSDWGPYSNDNYLCGYCQYPNEPGRAVFERVADDQAVGMATLVTVPIVDYVSADKSGLVSESQFAVIPGLTTYTRFNVNVSGSGDPAGTVNTSDKYVYQDQFVHWLQSTFPEASRTAPVFFSLDNEPALWPYTHPEVHQPQPTYTELATRTTDFASMIKDLAPTALVFGPVTYGWNAMVNLQGASDAGGRDFLDFYLETMQDAHTSQGRRLLDVLDIHWYPEARGGGTRITNLDGPSLSSAQIEAIVQAPRSYWDPGYREDSWIADWIGSGYQGLPNIQLIPRLRAQVAGHYPGTRLAITEHYPGGGQHIAGGVAQADILGIFGREGLFAATLWELSGNSPYVYGGYRCYLNYDSAGSKVGDLGLPAVSSDIVQSSVYAMRSSSDASKLWVVAINKTSGALPAHITISNGAGYDSYEVYRLTSAGPTPQHVTTGSMSGGLIDYTMPAYSVTTLELSAPAGGTPSLSVGDVTLSEGDAGTTNATFTVTLSPE